MYFIERFSTAVQIISEDKSFTNNPDLIISILKENPTLEFALQIADKLSETNLIPLEKIVSALLESNKPENGIKFLKIYMNYKNSIGIRVNINELKLAYNILLKFTYLAFDEVHFLNETET